MRAGSRRKGLKSKLRRSFRSRGLMSHAFAPQCTLGQTQRATVSCLTKYEAIHSDCPRPAQQRAFVRCYRERDVLQGGCQTGLARRPSGGEPTMDNRFFERPILNSPYDDPARHWELDDQGQPTQLIIDTRRRAEFISPIPKPRKRKGKANQQDLVFDEGKGLSTQEQQYDQTSIINELRHHVDLWRNRQ